MQNTIPHPRAPRGITDEAIIQAIDEHWHLQRCGPSIRELCIRLGFGSTAAMCYRINKLVKSGDLVENGGSKSRTLRSAGLDGWLRLGVWYDPD